MLLQLVHAETSHKTVYRDTTGFKQTTAIYQLRCTVTWLEQPAAVTLQDGG